MAVLFIAVFFYLEFFSENKNNVNPKNNAANDKNNYTNISGVNRGTNTTTAGNSGGSSEVGGGTGSGASGGGGGEGGGDNQVNTTREIIPSSCTLVRPGNLPDITCSVNYIKKDSISLKMRNALGEKIFAIIKIDTCSESNGTIENNQEKDFNFSCNNKNYFNEVVSLTYILEGNKRTDVGGFVIGSVEN